MQLLSGVTGILVQSAFSAKEGFLCNGRERSGCGKEKQLIAHCSHLRCASSIYDSSYGVYYCICPLTFSLFYTFYRGLYFYLTFIFPHFQHESESDWYKITVFHQ